MRNVSAERGSGEWNIHFPRTLNNWDVEVVGRFLEKLSGTRSGEMEDTMV